MKLVIDIPEEYYNNLLKNCRFSSEEIPIVSLAIAVATPLEKHDEEVIKETVKSVWGKPPYTEVLDSIKAEIEQYKADCDLTCSDDSNCRTCNNITFGTIYQIIDKYRGERNE